ncbi:MAG: hypothetical protein U5N85_07950 [Arcicella sp.]|nr:hypothetical protein [Arcicella sp.]
MLQFLRVKWIIFLVRMKPPNWGVNIAGAIEGGYSLAKKGLAWLKNGLNGLKSLFIWINKKPKIFQWCRKGMAVRSNPKLNLYISQQ